MPAPLTDKALDQILAIMAAEDAVFLESVRITEEEHRSLLFRRPIGQIACYGGDDLAIFFSRIDAALANGHYLAGWLAYEFGTLLEPRLAHRSNHPTGTLLGWFGIFPPPHVFDHLAGPFGPINSWPAASPAPATQECQTAGLHSNISRETYLDALARIKEYIAAGDTYQVNYTFKLLFELTGSPEALYRALRRNQSVSYAAYLRNGDHRILSFSPELFFRKEKGFCTVRPMKGTIRRGPSPAEDAKLAEQLRHDPKNRSENVMIVDLLRNDLGRVSLPGSVTTTSLFDVETYETLHQMTSTIKGQLPANTDTATLFRALFPCGSVTGAPKIRTMEIIGELEPEPRGVYTGAIGYLAPDGGAVFNVPIRTVELSGCQGTMGVGSGVVFDSQPEQEWQECLLKGRFLSDPAPAFQLIETLLWQPGSGYWLLPKHLARLTVSAAHFLFSLNPAEIEERLAAMAGTFAQSCQRVRLTVAKDGALTLSAVECPPPTWATGLDAIPPPQAQLPCVAFSDKRIDPSWPWLFHKTTRRELYDAERQQATAAGLYEVLFTNTRGEATEGAITNLYIQRDGMLLTPPVASGLLAGVLRQHLLTDPSLVVREAVLTRKEVEEAQAVFVGNSVRGLVRVRVR